MDVVPPQLSLLIWKCYVTSIKRRKLTFALEVLVPGLLALTLVYARLHVTFETVHNVTLFEHLSINRLPLRYRLPPPSASKWILYYAPNTELVNMLLNNVANDAVPQLEARGFETEEAMVAHYTAEMAHRDSVLGGIVFPDFENNATQIFVDRVRFKVRLKAAPRMKLSNSEPLQSWSTDSNFPVLQVFSPRHPKNKDDGSPGYFAEGFLYLQQEVFQEVLVHMVNQGNFNVSMPVPTTVLLQRFPLPPYTTDPFFFIIQYFLPIIVLLCFTSPSLSVIRHVSTEKESGMRDFLHMMGINPWLNYIAWFLVTLMAMTISSVVLVFTTMTPLTGNGPVIRNSNPLVILLLFVVYSTSTINFAFLVGSLFNSANTSVAGLFTAYTASFFPFLLFFSMNNTHTTTATILACLLCNTALPLGVTMTAVLEAGNEGAQWNNIALNPNPGLGLSLFSIINMLIFDSVLYAVLVWYIEGSHMNRLVDREPWTFFKVGFHLEEEKRTFRHQLEPQRQVPSHSEPGLPETRPKDATSVYFEEFSLKAIPGVELVNLTKVYNKVPVVNNVSFKAFRGQITALLGHNGAGKTTTIRMMTGQLASTKGLVLIGGHNVKTQSQAAHEDMGICPQTDIHFKDMTVYEHLFFFSELKRVPSSEIEQQLCKLLSLLKMSQKRQVLARHLSGGYRRKLSIGIALVGNSKVVILDEPTSGLDPAARREIWDLLILEKANRTILLTTHAMEEADAIGDRIAIMANGVIQCCGTSFFLKKNLGAGYHMVIVKNPVCNVRTLLEVVAAFAPSAEMESNVGTELSLRISRFDQPFFKHLFSHLEDNKEKLGISSFGVSVTTLEEVFLRNMRSKRDCVHTKHVSIHIPLEIRHRRTLVRLTKSDSQLIGILNSFMPASGSSDESGEKSPTNTGLRLFVQQTWALLTMNMLNSVRNVQLTVSQLLVPLAVLSFTLTWIDLLPKVYVPSARLLDINRIHWSTVPYSFRGNKSRSLIEAFKNQLDSYRV
ncbi:unnamed protein product, partial [Ixodes pacificus]